MWIGILIIVFVILCLLIKSGQKQIVEKANNEEDINKLNAEIRSRTEWFMVAGISYRSESEIKVASELKIGDTILLVAEPDNCYDIEAVKVMTQDNIQIGYVPRDQCIQIKAILYNNPNCKIYVASNLYGSLAPRIKVNIEKVEN